MSFSLTKFKKSLKSVFDQIKKDQAEALSIEISANFIAGMSAAETHKSFKSEDPEEEGLTTEEKAEIAALIALYLGYISSFNDKARNQILSTVKKMGQSGSSPEEIKKYVDNVFSGEESIKIDNTGKKKKEIYVDKDLKLSEVTKIVEKPFYAGVLTYASMLGSNASHVSYEAGKKTQNISAGYSDWVFVGQVDEKARPWHVALLGEVFEYGSEQSSYAENCLKEPNCRHRAHVYFGDPAKDTAPEKWEKLKENAGLFWNQETEMWDIS